MAIGQSKGVMTKLDKLMREYDRLQNETELSWDEKAEAIFQVTARIYMLTGRYPGEISKDEK